MTMPSRIAVVTDSTADLSAEQAADYGITVVPLTIRFGNESLLDGVDLHPSDFMTRMEQATSLPTTSQPPSATFEEVFRSLSTRHDHVICITVSSRLSGTWQSATLAAEAVRDTIAVTVLDSLTVSVALGSQAIAIASMAAADEPVEDIVAMVAAEADRYHTIFFVDGLDHLRRGGRIGKAAQLLGSALQLRPLLRVEEGQIVPFERTRTRTRAIAALEEFATEAGALDRASVIYTTMPGDAAALAHRIATATGVATVPQVQVGPVIAAHVGPGMLGVSLREAAIG
jgi:DegV family protein with EDD domain